MTRCAALVFTLLSAPLTSCLLAAPRLAPHGHAHAHAHHRPTPAAVGRPRAAPAVAVAAPAVRAVVAVGLNSGLAALGVSKGVGTAEQPRVLTRSGLANAWLLGVMLWASLGWRGWSVCVVYLIIGSAVTKVKKAKKEALGIAEGRGGARGPENVWGAAATAAACAIGAAVCPAKSAALRLAFVASLATKLSDTCASEIGKAYGKTTYLITTLKLVPPGTEGAVSAEGTAAGALGSVVLTGFAMACGLVGPAAALPCVLAAFIATNVESLIGALAQDRFRWLTNEVVNWIMTVVGAVVSVPLGVLLGAL